MADPGKGNDGKGSPSGGSPSDSGKNGSSLEQRQQLSDLLLRIVESEIGRGEPRRPEDWARLRTMALGHPGAADLVTELEAMIGQFDREMERHGRAGLGLQRIRESVVHLVRVSLLKKLGLPDRPPVEGEGRSLAAAPPVPEKDSPALQQNRLLTDHLLAIIEREIGRGEARRPEEWAQLRELAAHHPGTANLVNTLDTAIQQCNQELINGPGRGGADLSKMRQSMVALIRVTLLKKMGLADSGRTTAS